MKYSFIQIKEEIEIMTFSPSYILQIIQSDNYSALFIKTEITLYQ